MRANTASRRPQKSELRRPGGHHQSDDVLLMDEPCSALDPVSTLQIESLMRALARDYTILVVTHNMQQAARISDETGFMLLGELIEMGPTADVFTRPRDRRTEDYVTGRFG